MFQLICFLLCLPFYLFYIVVKVEIYILIFIIKLISNIVAALLQNERNYKSNKFKTTNSLISIENNSKKLSYNDEKEVIVHKSEYKLTQITDIELKITIDKIQEIYKELGFDVKVINIIKEKYITEYEVIFPQNVTQAGILSVLGKVINEFEIDGVKIVGNTKKNNRIYIQIPLKYEKTLT